MRQLVTENHTLDETGNPTGGQTQGTGIHIQWQNGPLGRDENRQAPNGAFVEGVIQAALGRLEFYQSASDGRFACTENATAILKLQEALAVLDERTQRRTVAGTEGTHAPDAPPSSPPATEPVSPPATEPEAAEQPASDGAGE